MNPIQRLKQLPWKELFLTALITNLGILILEFAIGWGYTVSPVLRDALKLLLAPPLGILTAFAIAVGVGILAVYYLERIYPNLLIDAGVLWALIFCLIVIAAVKSVLGLPSLLISLSEFHLLGMILGVFLRGRRYWR